MPTRRSRKRVKRAAILTVFRADEMTPRGRREVATWLRARAACLIANGKNYTKRFTARYLYE